MQRKEETTQSINKHIWKNTNEIRTKSDLFINLLKMFLTIVLAILFVIYGIPLLLTLIAAIFEWIGELFENYPIICWGVVIAIVIWLLTLA